MRRGLRALPLVVAVASVAACGTEEWNFTDPAGPATGALDAAPIADASSADDVAVPLPDASALDAGDANARTDDAGGASCTDDTTCQGLHCDPSSGHCVDCTGNSQCPMDHPICDPMALRCVECEGDSDCNPGGACVRGQCVPSCASGASCPESAPICTSPHQVCLGCSSDQDCASVHYGPNCNRQTGQCVPECLADRNCPSSRPRCDRDVNRCERCLADSDCPQGDACTSMHTCVAPRDQ